MSALDRVVGDGRRQRGDDPVFRKRAIRAAALLVIIVLAACNGLTVNEKGVYTSSPTQDDHGHRQGRQR